MTFEELKNRQQAERIAFVAAYAKQGLTVTQTSKKIGLSIPALVQFAQRHGIRFAKSNAGD